MYVCIYVYIGEGYGNTLHYSCLENSMDRGVWWAIVHGVAKSKLRLSTYMYIYIHLYIDTRIHAWNTAAAKLLQSCLTLCDPRDGSPPGSPIPWIPQARIVEWVAISPSNE